MPEHEPLQRLIARPTRGGHQPRRRRPRTLGEEQPLLGANPIGRARSTTGHRSGPIAASYTAATRPSLHARGDTTPGSGPPLRCPWYSFERSTARRRELPARSCTDRLHWPRVIRVRAARPFLTLPSALLSPEPGSAAFAGRRTTVRSCSSTRVAHREVPRQSAQLLRRGPPRPPQPDWARQVPGLPGGRDPGLHGAVSRPDAARGAGALLADGALLDADGDEHPGLRGHHLPERSRAGLQRRGAPRRDGADAHRPALLLHSLLLRPLAGGADPGHGPPRGAARHARSCRALQLRLARRPGRGGAHRGRRPLPHHRARSRARG